MRQSIQLRQQMRDSINQEIADRTKAHQKTIARLKTAGTQLKAIGAPAAPSPLVMLAHGDSWFDYPLDGNSVTLGTTDVIAKLGAMGNFNPVILNLSHHGDATTDEMSLPKQQRMIEALQDSDNWMGSGKPDAILFSGGGNDIAGDQFCIFLDYAMPGSTGLDAARFQRVLGLVEASYLDLFAFRDKYAPGVPVYGHCYDFPIPNGVHPICAGPWLKPSLDFTGWNVTQGTAIIKQALTEFKNLLVRLASDPANNFKLVDTQGLLAPDDWANELHPYPNGFKAIAERFVDTLRISFPGRI
ncbi:MAG TPA: hypothetical protein VI298_10835 [Geobacteraceae bacterium]